MKVKAKLMGFYKGRRVRPGTVLDFTGPKLPKWVEPIEAQKAEAKAEAQKAEAKK